MPSVFVCFIYKMSNSVELNIGNAEVTMMHYPPTYTDIMEIEEALARRYGVDKVIITSWRPLSEED